MEVSPYLFFQDQCEAAFRFYERALGGKIEMMMRNGEAPADMPSAPERKNLIMHARISFDGEVLLGSDAPPDRYNKPQGYSVCLTFEDPADAERKFKALSDGGNVSMPFSKTFFAQGFGMCQDKFGISWMIHCPMDNPHH